MYHNTAPNTQLKRPQMSLLIWSLNIKRNICNFSHWNLIATNFSGKLLKVTIELVHGAHPRCHAWRLKSQLPRMRIRSRTSIIIIIIFADHKINVCKCSHQTLLASNMIVRRLVLNVLLGIALLTVSIAQEDCPDRATECPDNCADALCPRFLNAKCRENPCHGLCTPNFFRENGQNVTDRCDVERCKDKECPGKRDCIEDVVPASCPATNRRCRQFIRSRCVLPPPPTDCSQITCGPGMYCREGRGGKKVMCARARNCFQLTCDEGFICLEMEGGPMCTINKPMSCEEAECPEGAVCSEFNVPSRDIAIAQCLPQATADRMPVFGNEFSCSSGFPICDEQTEACTEAFEDGRRLTVSCNIVNCSTSDSTSCPHNRVCTDIPPLFVETLQVPFTKSCSPPGFVFNETCVTAVDPCPAGLACHDMLFEGTTIGVACGVSAPTYSGTLCAELGCPEPLECFERIIEGRGSLAQCTTEEAADIVVETILGHVSESSR